jgi:hypothetical protein
MTRGVFLEEFQIIWEIPWQIAPFPDDVFGGHGNNGC